MKKNTTGKRLIPPALRSRNYRLFFGGQSLSLIGTWMTQIAMSWFVYQLTGSPMMLGLVGFTSQIPSFVLSPFGGVVVDRWNTHRLLVTTQILAMLQSLALAALALTHIINIWHIIFLSLFQGLINAFDAPARQTFVKEMIEKKKDLGSAIALNSSLLNGARLVGPAMAGFIIARIGSGYCFLIDGISYIAVIAALLAMKLKPSKISNQTTNPLQRLEEGFTYAFGFLPIRSILLLLALFSIVAMPYFTLMPIFATNILHGRANTLGFLTAASGVGALGGGIYLSTRKTVLGLERIIAFSPAISGIGIVAFGFSHVLWFSLLMVLLVGLSSILLISSCNTVIQTIVEDDKRGRVMSLLAMSFFGMAPFGDLFAGSLAEQIGAPNTLLIGGTFSIVSSLLFAKQLPTIRRLVKPIYIQAAKEIADADFVQNVGLDWQVMVGQELISYREYQIRVVLQSKGMSLDQDGEIVFNGVRLKDTMPPSVFELFVKGLEAELPTAQVNVPHPNAIARPDKANMVLQERYGVQVRRLINDLFTERGLISDGTNGRSLLERPVELLAAAIERIRARGYEPEFKNNSALVHSAVFGFLQEKTERKWSEHTEEQQYTEAVALARQFLFRLRQQLQWRAWRNFSLPPSTALLLAQKGKRVLPVDADPNIKSP